MANLKWPTLVLFGDSLTQFSFSYDGGWGALIADQLQRKCDVINRGFSGYNSRWCKTLLPRIFNEEYAKNVAVVTIFLGANDSNFKEFNPRQHVPLDEFKDNIMDMIKFLKSIGITKEKIIIIGPPPTDTEEWAKALAARDPPMVMAKCNKQTSQYSLACQTAAEECDVTFVELFNAMQDQEITQPTCSCGTCTNISSSQTVSPHSSNKTESGEKDEVPDDVISSCSSTPSENIMPESEDTSRIQTPLLQATAPWLIAEETSHSALNSSELVEFFRKALNDDKKKKFHQQILNRIEQQLLRFVKSKQKYYTFGEMTSYVRMLVHHVADLYKLDHCFWSSRNCVVVKKTACTEIPKLRFKDLINGKISKEELSSDNLHQQKWSTKQEETEEEEEENRHISLTDDEIPPWLSKDSQNEKIQDDLNRRELEDFFKLILNKSPQHRTLLLSFEQQLIKFINNPKKYYYKFGEMSSYNRMLVHRVAALFGLQHHLERCGKKVLVKKTPNTKIPEFRFQDHIPEKFSETVSSRKDSSKTTEHVHCKESWKNMFCDGLHFSRQGSEFVARKLWPVIDQKTSHLPMLLPLWSDVDNNKPEETLLK